MSLFPKIDFDIPHTVNEFLTVLRNIDAKLDTLIEEQQEANRSATMDRLGRTTRERQDWDRNAVGYRLPVDQFGTCPTTPADTDLAQTALREVDDSGWCVPCVAAGVCDLSALCGRKQQVDCPHPHVYGSTGKCRECGAVVQ